MFILNRYYQMRFPLNKCVKNVCSTSTNSRILRNFNDIPQPFGLPVIGTFLQQLLNDSSQNLHKYINKRHSELGVIFKEKIGSVDCVFLSDPYDIRNIFYNDGKYPKHILPEPWIYYNQLYGCKRGLFFMDDEDWLHHRQVMSKLLLKDDLLWINNCCELISDNLVDFLSANTEFNLEQCLYKWSVETMLTILLGSNTYKKANLQTDLTNLSKIMNQVFVTTSKLGLIPTKLAIKFNLKLWRNFVDSVHLALDESTKLIKHLLTNYPNNDGLLSQMLNENITEENLIRIVVDMVLASGDTTAFSMEWILYLISKNPEYQRKLRANPELTRNVLRESLRLYPIAPFLTRILPENCHIHDYFIPANTIVIMSIYTSGGNPGIYKNPNDFIPERWDRHNPDYSREMQMASLPFALGARSCIGKKIAEKQIQMSLLKIMKNFRVELLNRDNVDMIMKMVAVPSVPIQLKFNKL